MFVIFAIDLLKDRIFGEIQLNSLLLDIERIHFDTFLNHSALDVKN